MRGYHAIANMLRVDRSDDCVWLVSEGSEGGSIHMTPDQATAVGEALLEVGGSSDSMSLPVTDATGTPLAGDEQALDEEIGDVVAGLMDKWRERGLSPESKDDLEKLSQARGKIRPPVEVYAAVPGSAKNKLQGAVLMIEKFIERAEKAVKAKDKRAAETSRGLARKKLMGLIETLASQRQLSGYTSGLTEAHRLLAVA